MSATGGRHRGRWVAGVAAVVLVLVAAAVLVGVLLIRDSARPLSTEEVVGRFRAESTAEGGSATTEPSDATEPTSAAAPTTTGAGDEPGTDTTIADAPAGPAGTTIAPARSEPEEELPALVEPGVYRYRTTGDEQIDALGGANHSYPPQTTITALSAGCGVSMRWDALQERWDEWMLCARPEGIELQPDGTQFHQFFGQSEREALTCDVPVVLVPRDPGLVDLVQPQTCSLADDPWLPTWTVGERSRRDVEGEEVEVRHVQMRIEDDDEYWERTVVDWYLAADGLPVEVVAMKESRSPSPVGGVVYREDYRLELESLTPLR